MLYISRPLGVSLYGVVDTDDDTETEVNWRHLSDCCVDQGMHIEGVTVASNVAGRFIKDVTPYQDKRYYSPKQAKLKMLAGVDIRTWRNEITYIAIDFDVMRDGTRVVLSEYARSMSGRISVVWNNRDMRQQKRVILVLDDMLFIKVNAPSPLTKWVVWDVSAVSNDGLVAEMYEVLHSNRVEKKDWKNYMIDTDKRTMRKEFRSAIY